MTREEAIKHITAWIYATSDLPPKQVAQALDMAISALRPITREQVEKVWKPCRICGEERALYQSTRNTKLYVATFGKRKMLETESNACPPYSNCSRKNIPVCAGFEIEYCPKCGRPLTAEAMQMVMERLEALHGNR